MSIKTNLEIIKARVAEAARKVGRDPKEIKLLVAGKYADIRQLEELVKAGQKLIGENRAQDLTRKYAVIGDQAEWHFIGHLQRNKVKDVVPLVTMLHSLDSIRLADELERQLGKINKVLPVLIEVNVAGEATNELVKYCRSLPHLKLKGLMTMNQHHFHTLRQLAKSYNLPELSMGMSADFEVAIEEGATMIRLGRIVFSEIIV